MGNHGSYSDSLSGSASPSTSCGIFWSAMRRFERGSLGCGSMATVGIA